MSTMVASLESEHQKMAAELVGQMHRLGGLAPVDLERFWAEDAQAKADPFAADCPQVPLGVMMSGEAVWAELGLTEDWDRYETDRAFRLALHQAYNDKAQPIVGRRLLGEKPHDPTRQYPRVRELYHIFEAQQVWHNGSWWLQQSAHDEAELEALLDRVERRLENLRSFLLPDNWESEKARLQALGVKSPLYRGQRGPVTFATSIYGAENFLFLLMDRPELGGRFRDLILRAMLERGRILDEEAGYTPATAPKGFGFADDNCVLLTPELYAFFAAPILKAIWERYAPGPRDSRYQHSDSAMAHHLPQLGALGITGTNFGPTVTVQEIRHHCPRAVIHGQLAPFTFSRNQEENIVREFLRDFQAARPAKGLVFATAGSINNGSRLTGMRLIMAAIQKYGRYC